MTVALEVCVSVASSDVVVLVRPCGEALWSGEGKARGRLSRRACRPQPPVIMLPLINASLGRCRRPAAHGIEVRKGVMC